MPARQCSSVDLPEPGRAHHGDDLAGVDARTRRRRARGWGRRPCAGRSRDRAGSLGRCIGVTCLARAGRAARRSAPASAGRPRGGTARGRRSAGRRGRPCACGSVSSRISAQVLGALGVEDVGGVAVGQQGEDDLGVERATAGTARASPGSASQRSTSVTPASVIAYRLRSGPPPASMPSTSTSPFFSSRDIVE